LHFRRSLSPGGDPLLGIDTIGASAVREALDLARSCSGVARRRTRHGRCTTPSNPFERIATMHDLDQNELTTVTGGTTSTTNQQITTQLQALQTSLTNATTNNNSGSNSTMMMLCMMMAMRPQAPTVVAGGGEPMVAAAAPGPVVNINTRVRRF
jgi:hypothetical protein